MSVPPLETRLCIWDEETGQMVEVYVQNGDMFTLPDVVENLTDLAICPNPTPVIISKNGSVEIRGASRVVSDSAMEYLISPVCLSTGDVGKVLFDGCEKPVNIKPASVVRFGNRVGSTKILAPKNK